MKKGHLDWNVKKNIMHYFLNQCTKKGILKRNRKKYRISWKTKKNVIICFDYDKNKKYREVQND